MKQTSSACILICFLCVFAFLFEGCTQSPINAQTEYITRQGLASYHIGTPDPSLNHPVVGQRMILKWSLPEDCMKVLDLHMVVTMRFRDGSQRGFNMDIYKSSGIKIYTLPTEEFCQTGGINTFKVDLVGDGNVLYEWRHQLWVELIDLKDSDDNQLNENDLENPSISESTENENFGNPQTNAIVE